MNNDIKVVCITRVRNEEWILERFLRCAELWADHIILADQHSEDRSEEIARKFSKVSVVKSDVQKLDAYINRKADILLNEVDKIKGEKLLITLDADEMLTANFSTSPEWQTCLTASHGTTLYFKWINLYKDTHMYWFSDQYFGWGLKVGENKKISEALSSHNTKNV